MFLDFFILFPGSALADDMFPRGGRAQGQRPNPRANILDFYSDLSVQFETKKDADEWKSVLSELDKLKSTT